MKNITLTSFHSLTLHCLSTAVMQLHAKVQLPQLPRCSCSLLLLLACAVALQQLPAAASYFDEEAGKKIGKSRKLKEGMESKLWDTDLSQGHIMMGKQMSHI